MDAIGNSLFADTSGSGGHENKILDLCIKQQPVLERIAPIVRDTNHEASLLKV